MLKILVVDISRMKCASNMEYVKIFFYSFVKQSQKKLHSCSGRFKIKKKNQIKKGKNNKTKLFTEFEDFSNFCFFFYLFK